MSILAIDPGSTNVGICYKGQAWKTSIKWKTDEQLIKGLDYFVTRIVPAQYIIIESQMRAPFKKFVTVAVTLAWTKGVKFKVVHPMTVKRHFGIKAKRNHTENKKAAVLKVQELWPEKDIKDHNIADAVLMHEYAKHLISQNKF